MTRKNPESKDILLALSSLKRVGDLQALSISVSLVLLRSGPDYEAHRLASPLGIRARSTMAVASSQAFLSVSSMDDICAAAG